MEAPQSAGKPPPGSASAAALSETEAVTAGLEASLAALAPGVMSLAARMATAEEQWGRLAAAVEEEQGRAARAGERCDELQRQVYISKALFALCKEG